MNPKDAKFELVIDKKTGQVRQAGAAQADGDFVQRFRARAQADLFTMLVGVLNMHWLYEALHRRVCEWLQTCPPKRKALIMPRNHCKSTITCQGMPIHMFVQDPETNPYFPGLSGLDTRILMIGEKEDRVADHLRVVRTNLESNALLRALWPQVAWENPKRDAKAWNDSEIILPRPHEWPDPSLRVIGIGGATTGSHPNCQIKDDLTTEEAANSPTVMQRAIAFHRNSRALFDDPKTALEFNQGTKWAVGDMVDDLRKDPTVEECPQDWQKVVVGGEAIYPTKYGHEGAIEELMQEHGVMFPLLYMNTVDDSGLTDFNKADLRYFEIRGGNIVITEDDRDIAMRQKHEKRHEPPKEPEPDLRGRPLSDLYGKTISKTRIDYIRGCRSA